MFSINTFDVIGNVPVPPAETPLDNVDGDAEFAVLAAAAAAAAAADDVC